MESKKNFRGGLRHLLLLSFFILFVISSQVSAVEAWEKDVELSSGEMSKVISQLALTNRYSGDVLETATNTYNKWARVQLAQGNTFSLLNIVFFRNQNQYLCWLLIDGGTSSNFPDVILRTSSSVGNNVSLNNIVNDGYYSSINLYAFISWNYNTSTGNISSVNVASLPCNYISYTNPSTVSSSGSSSFGAQNPYDFDNTLPRTITYNSATVYVPNFVNFWRNQSILMSTSSYGSGFYQLINTVDIASDRIPDIPTPTPTAVPTAFPTGGGGDGGRFFWVRFDLW